MPSPVMVRMDDDLLAKLDRDRGTLNRSAFIRRLVADHPSTTTGPTLPDVSAVTRTPPQTVRVARGSPKGAHATQRGMSTPKPSDCSHPVSRRIGDGCGACGATGLAKKK